MSWTACCVIRIGNLCLQSADRKIVNTKLGREVILSESAYQLLCYLATSANQVVELGAEFPHAAESVELLQQSFEQLDGECEIEKSRAAKPSYMLSAFVEIEWQYPCSDNEQSDVSIELESKQQLLSISYQQQQFSIELTAELCRLVTNLKRSQTGMVSLYSLANELGVSQQQLLIEVLNLQFAIFEKTQHVPWFLKFDGYELIFYTDPPSDFLVNKTTQSGESKQVSQLRYKIRCYQAALFVVMSMLFLSVVFFAVKFNSPSYDTEPDKASLSSEILRHISLYDSFENPIEPDELLDIAQQKFEKQKQVGIPLGVVETEYLLTLAESNLVMARYDKAKSLLQKVTYAVENLTTNTSFNQRLKLQYLIMQIWLHADVGKQQQARAFLTLAETTPTNLIRQQQVFWQLEVTKFGLYLQLGMFEQLVAQAEELIPILELQHDREIGILTTRLYDYYSTALRQLGRNKQSIAALEKATEWDEKTFATNRTSSASRLAKLAVVYTMEGQYDLGTEHYEQGLKIYRSFEQPNFHSIALTYSNMSFAQFEAGQVDAALKSIDYSISVAKQHLTDNGGILGYFHLIKAGHLFHLQDYQQAADLLDIAAPIIENDSAHSHPAQARLLLLKAQLSRDTGDVLGCHNYGQLAKAKFAAIYQQPQHWEQQLADMTKVSCELIDESRDEAQKAQAMELIKLTLAQFKTEYGADALPVRKFERGVIADRFVVN